MQRAGAQRIEAAEQRVSDARRQAATQARQSAQQIEAGQRSVIAAQRSLQQATVAAGTAGGAAMETLREKMDALSPAGKRFAEFLFGLRGQMLLLRAAAAEPMLPKLQQAITNLLPHLGAFREFVSRIAAALGDMFLQGVRALSDPTWRRFFSYISETAVPTLKGMFTGALNVATGLTSLFLALSPFNSSIGGGLLELSERFATWARQLETSQGYRRFLDYVAQVGPRVVHLLGEIGTFIGRLVAAAAPIGAVVLEVFIKLFEALNAIPISVLTYLVAGMAAFAAVLLTVRAALGATTLITQLVSTLTLAGTRVRDVATASMGRYTTATAAASAANGRFATSMIGMNAAVGGVGTKMAGLSSFLMGPWGIAIGAAIFGIGLLAVESAEYKAKVDGLRNALSQIADVHKRVTKAGQDSAEASRDALAGIVAQNPEMQRAVILLNGMGVSFDDLAAAAAGGGAQLETILAKLDAEISVSAENLKKLRFENFDNEAAETRLKDLKAMRAAILANANAMGVATQAQNIVTNAQNQHNDAANRWVNYSGPMSAVTFRALNAEYETNAAKIDHLKRLTDAFSGAQQTAAGKADAVRYSIERQTGAAAAAIETEEAWRLKLFALSDSVTANGRSLSLNTREGLRNRDALQAAAGAVRAMYLEDIAAGKPIERVTAQHKERIKALEKEAHRLKLGKEETARLIAIYGKVPDEVSTVITSVGFKKIFQELQALQFGQFILKNGIDPVAGIKMWEAQQQGGYAGDPRLYKAQGGLIRGPGTGTSDSITAMLSDEEFVQPAKTVKHYGVPFMEDLRKRRIPREALPGYAAGGLVKWPFKTTTAMTKIMTKAEALSRVSPMGGIGAGPGFGRWPSSPSAQRGDSGVWKSILKLIKSTGPVSGHFGNAYRHGDPLWHGSGRAIDWMGYNQDALATFLSQRRPLELIHRTNRRDYAYTRGKNQGSFNNSLMQAHRNHIHIAMAAGGLVGAAPQKLDSGGMLPPGLSLNYNGTRRPEPVLSARQWRDIGMAGKQAAVRPNHVYNFEFRDTTLTMSRLQALQDRQAAYDREGRAS